MQRDICATVLGLLQELCDIVGTQFGEYWPKVKIFGRVGHRAVW